MTTQTTDRNRSGIGGIARLGVVAAAGAALMAGALVPAEPTAAAGCGNTDADYDGLTCYQEYNIYGTDSNDWDTDGDGYGDGEEVLSFRTDPLVHNGYGGGYGGWTDTDYDGLTDADESTYYITSPYLWDTDGDGWSDGEEVYGGSSPTNRFCDPSGCG